MLYFLDCEPLLELLLDSWGSSVFLFEAKTAVRQCLPSTLNLDKTLGHLNGFVMGFLIGYALCLTSTVRIYFVVTIHDIVSPPTIIINCFVLSPQYLLYFIFLRDSNNKEFQRTMKDLWFSGEINCFPWLYQFSIMACFSQLWSNVLLILLN